MKWLLIVVFYGSPPVYHMDQTRVYEYNTLSICREAKAEALNYGAVKSAKCVSAKAQEARKS